MQQQLRAAAFVLALLGSAGFAAAQGTGTTGQGATGSAPMATQSGAKGKLSLTPAQERTITQALAGEREQSAPAGFQAEIGSKLPAAVMTRALPSAVAAQIPEAGTYHFAKIEGKVLLVDPGDKTVVEVIDAMGTTGSAPGASPGTTGARPGMDRGSPSR